MMTVVILPHYEVEFPNKSGKCREYVSTLILGVKLCTFSQWILENCQRKGLGYVTSMLTYNSSRRTIVCKECLPVSTQSVLYVNDSRRCLFETLTR